MKENHNQSRDTPDENHNFSFNSQQRVSDTHQTWADTFAKKNRFINQSIASKISQHRPLQQRNSNLAQAPQNKMSSESNYFPESFMKLETRLLKSENEQDYTTGSQLRSL